LEEKDAEKQAEDKDPEEHKDSDNKIEPDDTNDNQE
jgi:cell division protease FtsH